MCGRLNVSDDPFVTQLLLDLDITDPKSPMRYGRFKRATDVISIVREHHGTRRLEDSIWWLLLEPSETGYKPSKYTSFNTRYDKLNVPRSAGYTAYRHSRCVIVVKGFGETQFVNKKPVHYHDMTAKDGAIALAGLCREWVHKPTGEVTTSCSVITLPAHHKLQNIHTKASPLMLPQHDGTIDAWLDPEHQDVSSFEHLLHPHIPHDLVVQQIDKPSSYQPISESYIISKD